MDSFDQNNFDKSSKKTSDKHTKKYVKEKEFLGKKRDLIKLLKSNKTGKLNESGKKLENKTLSKNTIKSKKKHQKTQNEKNISKNEDIQSNSHLNLKQDNQSLQSNKKNSIDSNLVRNHKILLKNEKLEKEEFSFLLKQNREEYLHLGMDINPITDSLAKGNFNSINSDFTQLTLDLFSSTKFENSKPFKMIDYILNSDQRYLTSTNDKETYEEIKKTIYNKKSNPADYSQIVFKSLYQYFKTDFSFSYIYKIFHSCNELIEKFYNPDIGSNPDDTFGGFFFDKKDKFTYQNYLLEKLKNNYNYDWMREINDKEMIKSLIYLCNKHMKQSFKNLNGNSENNFVNVLKENLRFLENSENEMNHGDNLLENATFKKIKKKLLDNKEFYHLLKKKLKRLFSFKDFCNRGEYSSTEIKKLFLKILEMFTKSKEDDYEKILNKIKKIEKELDKEKDGKNDQSQDNKFKNVKAFWIKFKIIFYMITLGDTNIKSYITDESFWRLIIDFIREKKLVAQQEIKQTYTAVNNTLTKNRKGKRKIEKVSILETPRKKQITYDIAPENPTPAEEIQHNPFTSNKIFILNSVEKTSTVKNQIEENKSTIINPIDAIDSIINNSFISELKAYEFIESEFNKSLLTKIETREKLFEVVKEKEPETKKRTRRRKIVKNDTIEEKEEEVKKSEGEYENELKVNDDNQEDIVIKPKTVRVNPGFNPTGNIIINNFYNIISNSSEPPTLPNFTIIQNFSHQFENEKNVDINEENNQEITENTNVIKRKKGRPRKIEIKEVKEIKEIKMSDINM